MKQFFKFFTASCLGTIVALGLLTLVGVIWVSAASSKDTTVESGSVLKLDLNRSIPEKSDNVDTDNFSMNTSEAIGLRDIQRLIRKAADDDDISGILLSHSSLNLGQASILSLVDELNKFKESGKFLYSYADYYSQSAYFLNSVADSIILNPNGMIDIKGYATLIPFFKGGMDKLGIKMNIFYAGNFKSATEPFRRTDMSDPNKLQTREFLEGMMTHFRSQVMQARNMNQEQVDRIMNEYLGVNAQSCLENNLVDATMYWDDVEDLLRMKLEVEENKDINYIEIEEYKSKRNINPEGPLSDRIAIVYAEGTVEYGTENNGAITDKKYMDIFSEIRANDKVKAVVLRVNSGGGSALTSDIILKEIAHLKSDGIPVVASFGDLAASGGYYISANADTIVTMPNTLTGSIGVFTMLPNFKDLTNDKLGVTWDSVKTHQLAINSSLYLDMSQREKEIYQSETEAIYDRFLEIVAEGRGLSVDEVHAIAQGRVWTGDKAVEIGLADMVGDLDDALTIAADMAELEDYRVKEYPKIKKPWWQEIVKNLDAQAKVDMTLPNDQYSQAFMQEYRQMRSILEMTGPQMRLPYIYHFN